VRQICIKIISFQSIQRKIGWCGRYKLQWRVGVRVCGVRKLRWGQSDDRVSSY